MFDERADGNAGKEVISKAKTDYDQAKAELSNINSKIKDFENGTTNGTGEIDFQKTNEGDTEKTNPRKFETITKEAFDKLFDRLKKVFPKLKGINASFDLKEFVEKAKALNITENEMQKMIIAFHGSPHSFDKFTTKKIGTGEGRQYFGWGLYFTDLEGVARNYANNLTEHSIYINGKEVSDLKNTPLYNVSLFVFGQNNIANSQGKNNIIANLSQAIKDNRIDYNDATKAIKYLESLDSIAIKKDKRNLYKVSLHKGKTPSEYTWLEWDKPISNDILNKIADNFEKEQGENVSVGENKDGQELYNTLKSILGSDKEVSLFLLQADIDGVKFPAESISRGTTSDNARGFNNYVVFDENAVTVEEKIQFMKTAKGEIYGAVLPDGTMYFNPNKLNANTLIHEFGHIWEKAMPTAFKKGLEIFKQTKTGKELFAKLKKEGNYGKEDDKIWSEAMVMHIGNHGEWRTQNPRGKMAEFAQWMKDFFAKIGEVTGINKKIGRPLTADDNLRMFTEGVVGDLLGGKPITTEVNSSGKGEVKYSKRDLKNGAKALIKQVFEQVKKRITNDTPVSIANLSEDGKAYLSKISGLKFKNITSILINPSDLRHLYNDHFGNNEKDKGNNIPLNNSDIENIADTLQNPEKVIFLGKDEKYGTYKFAFLRKESNGTHNLITVYGNKGGQLSIKSLYKTKKDVSQRVIAFEKALLSTSETYFGAKSSLDIDANIPNLIDFDTNDVRNLLDGGNVDLEEANFSILKPSDFNADGTIKAEVLAEIEAEEKAIIAEAKANGTYMKAPNGKATNLNEKQWAQTRTQRFKDWFGDWETVNKLDLIENENPISVKSNNFSETQIKEIYQSLGEGENKFDNRKVRFVNATLGKILNHKGFDTKQIIPQLKQIFDNSVPIISEAEIEREGHKKHPNFKGYHQYIGKTNINGKEMYVRFTVQEVKTRNKNYIPNELHSTFISDIEIYNANDSGLPTPRLLTGRLASTNSVIDTKLQQFFEKAKNAKENASKVVDENGEPMVVYHGTNETFNEFDINAPIKNGRGEGNGFYFIAEKEIAKKYGKIIPTFLNIKNYWKGFDSLNESEKKAYLKTKSNEEAYKELGVDGIKIGGQIIALNPNQIKSATGNIGTFNEDSNDIRFQIIGEQGATALDKAEESTHRLDNLGVAREMETANKTPKEIRLVTGWERGADGKWRYEIEDIKIFNDTVNDKETGGLKKINTVGEWLENHRENKNSESSTILNEFAPSNELISKAKQFGVNLPTLFQAYPQLRNIKLKTHKISDNSSKGFLATKNNLLELENNPDTISIREDLSIDEANSVLIHEIQHAIQEIEGFAKGGNLRTVSKLDSEITKEIIQVEKILNEKIKFKAKYEWATSDKSIADLIDDDIKNYPNHYPQSIYNWAKRIADKGKAEIDLFLNETPFKQYQRLAGETESRNVQTRANMSMEERRSTLLSETEDVAREDQIILMESIGIANSMEEPIGLPKNLIPKSTINSIYEAAKSNGKEAGFEKLKESNWYNKLTDEQKNALNNDNFHNAILSSLQEHQKKEKTKIKTDKNAEIRDIKKDFKEKIKTITDAFKKNMREAENLKERLFGKIRIM